MNPGATAGATAATAAHAAAAAAAKRRQEEETMTPYGPDDLAGDWEFKIIRSAMGTFKKPERLREILEEEARAGWVLIEKFDDSRVRLKRPANAKDQDGGLDFDPYRTNVPGEGRRQLIMVGLVLGFVALVVGIVVLVGLVSR